MSHLEKFDPRIFLPEWGTTGARNRRAAEAKTEKVLEDSTYRHGVAFAGVMAEVIKRCNFLDN